MIPVTCPTCGMQKNVPDEQAGKKAKCKCGEVIRIPDVNPFDEKQKEQQIEIPITRSSVVEKTKPKKQSVESQLQTNPYSALRLIASINRILGLLTIVFSLMTCVAMFAKTDLGPMAIGLLVGGVIAGAVQLAFAELLELFMKLQMNTQYMCDRLLVIESIIKNLSNQNR